MTSTHLTHLNAGFRFSFFSKSPGFTLNIRTLAKMNCNKYDDYVLRDKYDVFERALGSFQIVPKMWCSQKGVD